MAGHPENLDDRVSELSQASLQDTEPQQQKAIHGVHCLLELACPTEANKLDNDLHQKEDEKTQELHVILQDKDKELQRKEQEMQELWRRFAEVPERVRSINKKAAIAGWGQEAELLDNSIVNKFTLLQGGVCQMVRSHLQKPVFQYDGGKDEEMAPELSELLVQETVATQLWIHFFSGANPIFGLDDDQNYNTLRKIERCIENGQNCHSDELAEWRARTVKLIKSTELASQNSYSDDCAGKIWGNLEQLCHHDKENESDRENARRDLQKICHLAYEIGLLCRSYGIEYGWEQMLNLESSKPCLDDYEVLGTFGPDPSEQHDIERVVFGGVIRGDTETGRLRDGLKRLTRATVTIGGPCRGTECKTE